MKTATIGYPILVLPVEKVGQIIRFQHSLPKHWVRCTGVWFTLMPTSPEYASGNGFSYMGGIIALEFNDKKKLLVNAAVGYNPNENSLCNFQEVNIPLEQNQLITGYYLDRGQLSVSEGGSTTIGNQKCNYQVRVYFRVTSSE